MSKQTILLDMKEDDLRSEDIFQAVLPKARFINWDDPKKRDSDLSSVHYAVVWGPQPGLLTQCTDLKVIFSVGAGVDHIVGNHEQQDIPIVRFVDQKLTGPMVEWVVLQVLLHLRQQRHYDAQQEAHNWNEKPQPPATDFRVGIMGFGELGQACAAALRSLGFQLNGWSQTQKSVDGVKSYFGADQLDAFLQSTDILVCLLPFTPDTVGILNRDLIGKLSSSGPFGAPVLINAGRGKCQVEADILQALNDGGLFGASLDVFETEPLPATSPLWDQPNLFITPHAAAVSDMAALASHVAGQVERFEAGEDLQYLVDRTRGY